jgi:hypothetical protein
MLFMIMMAMKLNVSLDSKIILAIDVGYNSNKAKAVGVLYNTCYNFNVKTLLNIMRLM